jgi:glycine/D-amino acid oxidase-like deaminating enzyme
MADHAPPILTNFWLDQALDEEIDVAEAPPLGGDAKVDVAIVGGGYTGLWTAIELKAREPSLDVMVIEKKICGWGASGRNAGYLLNLWPLFPAMKARFGRDGALAVGRASSAAIEAVITFCAEHAIDAEIRRTGWLWAATCQQHDGLWRSLIDDLADDQVTPYQDISVDEVAERWGLTGYVSAVLNPQSAHLQPAKLVRGMRRVALERGVRLHENTALTGLERGRPPVVKTARGRITADKVVIAMNAWSVAFRELSRAVIATGYANAVTEPMAEHLAETGFADAPCINDSRMMINALRPTVGGRVLIGKPGRALAFNGRVGDAFERDTGWLLDAERHRRELGPVMSGLTPSRVWSGPIDRSRDGLPIFGALPGSPDILHATGFSGDGVGPCWLAGKALASLALGTQDEWTDLGLVRDLEPDFPPDPVRWIGVRMVRRALARVDEAEHAGRKPDLLSRGLKGLMASGISSRE